MNIVHVYKSALLQTIIARLTIEIGEGNKESWEKLQLSIVIQQSDKSSHFVFFFYSDRAKEDVGETSNYHCF